MNIENLKNAENRIKNLEYLYYPMVFGLSILVGLILKNIGI